MWRARPRRTLASVGTPVTPTSPSRLFRQLFVADDADARKRRAHGYDVNSSILDAVNGQLIARPSQAVVAEFEAHMVARRRRDASQDVPADRPCQSRDGAAIQRNFVHVDDLVSAILMAVGALFLRHFPITRERHDEVRSALEARRAAGA